MHSSFDTVSTWGYRYAKAVILLVASPFCSSHDFFLDFFFFLDFCSYGRISHWKDCRCLPVHSGSLLGLHFTSSSLVILLQHSQYCSEYVIKSKTETIIWNVLGGLCVELFEHRMLMLSACRSVLMWRNRKTFDLLGGINRRRGCTRRQPLLAANQL